MDNYGVTNLYAGNAYNLKNNTNDLRNTTQKTKDGQIIDAVYADKDEKQVKVEDFLQLMITQLKNQDFTNPVDDTQYVTQLAQFSTMQYMKDLAYYSKSNYVMSLVGKDVTVAKLTVGGNVDKVTGPVERISLIDEEFHVFVKDKAYTLDEIMSVNNTKKDTNSSVDPSKFAIALTEKTQTTADIEWPVPTDDETEAAGLRYTVYYSTSPEFDTVDEVKSGIRFGGLERSELTSEKITGLSPDTTYFVNVVVKDVNGEESVYSKSAFTTLSEEV